VVTVPPVNTTLAVAVELVQWGRKELLLQVEMVVLERQR
jgi:hypothetical protein